MPAAWVYKSRELQPCEVCRLVLCEIVRAFTPDLQGFVAEGVGPEIYRVGTLWPGSCTHAVCEVGLGQAVPLARSARR